MNLINLLSIGYYRLYYSDYQCNASHRGNGVFFDDEGYEIDVSNVEYFERIS